MAESIKEVIARVKAQRENSQKSTSKPVTAKEVLKPITEDEDDELESEEEETAPQIKNNSKNQENTKSEEDQEIERQRQIITEIELLQNDGRFRAEMLLQLQEINQSLQAIVLLMDKNGK